MKKILTIALLTITFAVFTACHVDVNTDYHRHGNDLYVYNDSRYIVHDWYVEADDGWTEYPDERRIARGDRAKVRDLPDDYYRVHILLGDFDWYASGFTHIYCDTNYYVKNYKADDYFKDRSVIDADSEISGVLILTDGDGNEIELIKQ